MYTKEQRRDREQAVAMATVHGRFVCLKNSYLNAVAYVDRRAKPRKRMDREP